MRCPTGDGELIAHSTQGENNLIVSYSTCPGCRGYWMESFAANFIKLPPRVDEASPRVEAGPPPFCPICHKQLERAVGENIPDAVRVFRCPDNHGYFFPADQLAAFKMAQKTKITYHKLWNIPLPSVRSVLLAGLVIVILTGGFIAAYIGVQNRQTTTSQAHELLSSVHAYVTPNNGEVLIGAQTDYETTVTVHIPSFGNFEKELDSTDLLTHTIRLNNVPPGSYQYYFTLEFLGEAVQSKMYTFVMPQ